MDLVKIGKYIAGKRKNLGMTQKQKRLKYIIGILLVAAAIAVLTVGIMMFRKESSTMATEGLQRKCRRKQILSMMNSSRFSR